MKKKNILRIIKIVSAILLAAFVIKSIVDYFFYSNTQNSSPFIIWVLVNALYLLIPAIVVLVRSCRERKGSGESREIECHSWCQENTERIQRHWKH